MEKKCEGLSGRSGLQKGPHSNFSTWRHPGPAMSVSFAELSFHAAYKHRDKCKIILHWGDVFVQRGSTAVKRKTPANLSEHLQCRPKADFTGTKDVWAHAELVPEPLVAHGLPEVPQAEDCRQSHEDVRVVTCFDCHVSLFLGSSNQRQCRQSTV